MRVTALPHIFCIERLQMPTALNFDVLFAILNELVRIDHVSAMRFGLTCRTLRDKMITINPLAQSRLAIWEFAEALSRRPRLQEDELVILLSVLAQHEKWQHIKWLFEPVPFALSHDGTHTYFALFPRMSSAIFKDTHRPVCGQKWYLPHSIPTLDQFTASHLLTNGTLRPKKKGQRMRLRKILRQLDSIKKKQRKQAFDQLMIQLDGLEVGSDAYCLLIASQKFRRLVYGDTEETVTHCRD